MLTCSATSRIAIAQHITPHITPDNTLSTSVTLSTDGNTFTINNGDTAGNNLFHSFDTFSIPTGTSAVFNNSTSITNIISRVTGTTPSAIDGSISAQGTANLFLLNPNGIVFGPDAQLSIGGSFIASTAESLRFKDRSEFAINNPSQSGLLSISTPVGLQMGTTSGSIQVHDTGYEVLSADQPLLLDSSNSFLVDSGKSLVLVGSDVMFQGGVVAAPGGRIELGAVRSGYVSLAADSWAASYDTVRHFGDIQLAEQSLVDASDRLFDASGQSYARGSAGGTVQVRGRQLQATDGSHILVQNESDRPSGHLVVTASETIDLSGRDADSGLFTVFQTDSFGEGAGGDIVAIAPQFFFGQGNALTTNTYGSSASGNIEATAASAIFISGDANIVEDVTDALQTTSYATGRGGDINVVTPQLSVSDNGILAQSLGSGTSGNINVKADRITLLDNGTIIAATIGQGDGGNVTITALTIDVRGIGTATLFPSGIAASTVGSGNAGNLTINTQRLSLQGGGRIDSSTLASGNAGTITINATESVTVSEEVAGSLNPTLIISAANIIDPQFQAFLISSGINVPSTPSGNSGDVTINTPMLTVNDGAEVTVRNDGPGNAGSLTVNADTVHLYGNAGITSSTQQGNGGNVNLNLRSLLLLREGSYLSSEARGAGNGGNLTLGAPVIVALENSDIIANAFRGSGGKVQIDTQALIGTQFREQLTPESDITASSEFGLSGVVSIDLLDTDPSSDAVTLPENIADSDNQIVANCGSQAGAFIASGRGGLPINPAMQIDSNQTWQDLRAIATSNADAEPEAGTLAENTIPASDREASLAAAELANRKVIEAIAFATNEQGETVLTAGNNSSYKPGYEVACLRTAASIAH
ncbi:MAG: filamentous hemagglutinin N-terminal domain-containing protein [Cyanobacteria bacterium J06621_3]